MIRHLCIAALLAALPMAPVAAQSSVPSLGNVRTITPMHGLIGRGTGQAITRVRVPSYDDGCRTILRKGGMAAHCVMGFAAPRDSGKGARAKPAILGDLTAFSVGAENRFAVGVAVPGLIERLRSGRMVSHGVVAENGTGKGSR
jgi:hypothetical protein